MKAKLELSQDQMDFLTEMNEFNLEARYPDIQFNIYKKATPKLASHYHTETKKMILWLEKIIK